MRQLDAFGGALRDQALSNMEHATERRQEWVARARIVATELAQLYGQVTSDDVRKVCPEPDGVDPRIFGCVFTPRGKWKRVGFRPTTRRTAHARPIAVWALR